MQYAGPLGSIWAQCLVQGHQHVDEPLPEPQQVVHFQFENWFFVFAL